MLKFVASITEIYNHEQNNNRNNALVGKDVFYLVDRTKDAFQFPIHRHSEYELNFVENCRGASRVVGDSIETLGEYDLCLLGHGIEHAWHQNECKSTKIREITIQFGAHLFESEMLMKNQMASIRNLLEESAKGVTFDMRTIMKVYNRLESLISQKSGFYQMIEFMSVLYELSIDDNRRQLSTSSFANARPSSDSRRVQKVQDHIYIHYKEELKLETLADIAGMTPTSFSRFFKLRTGRSLSDYITDIRLGHAARALMDSTTSIAEICYECGFNNISNFNRILKKKKNCTPKEFREYYQRHQTIV